MFDVEDRALNEHDDSPDREEDTFDPAIAEEELATLSSHLDAATYRQLVLIRQLDECGHWATAGATVASPAATTAASSTGTTSSTGHAMERPSSTTC